MSKHSDISVQDLAKSGGSKGKVIDVRTPAEFGGSHIEGAELHPLSSLDPAKVKEFVGSGECYVMCLSGGRAGRAAEQLRAAGLPSVRVVTGGMKAWEAAGLPVLRGERNVIPVERQARIVMGALALTGAILGYFVNPAWCGLSAFAGAGLIYSGITDWCGLGLVLLKMPWNQGSGQTCCGSSCAVK